MGIQITCRGCDRPFRVADANAGKKLLCHCGGTITVPLTDDIELVDEPWGRSASGRDWRSEKKKEERDEDEPQEFDTTSFIKRTIGGGLALGLVLLVGVWVWSSMSSRSSSSSASQGSGSSANSNTSIPPNRPLQNDPRFGNNGLGGQTPNAGAGTGNAWNQQTGVTNPRGMGGPQNGTGTNHHSTPPPNQGMPVDPTAQALARGGFPDPSTAIDDPDDDDDFGSDKRVRPRTRKPAPTNSVLGTPPVATFVVSSLHELRRGMKVWRRDKEWQQVIVAGRHGDDLMILENAPTLGWRITPLTLRFARFEESELDRTDLESVPPLGDEPDLGTSDFSSRIAELKPAIPSKSNSKTSEKPVSPKKKSGKR